MVQNSFQYNGANQSLLSALDMNEANFIFAVPSALPHLSIRSYCPRVQFNKSCLSEPSRYYEIYLIENSNRMIPIVALPKQTFPRCSILFLK